MCATTKFFLRFSTVFSIEREKLCVDEWKICRLNCKRLYLPNECSGNFMVEQSHSGTGSAKKKMFTKKNFNNDSLNCKTFPMLQTFLEIPAGCNSALCSLCSMFNEFIHFWLFMISFLFAFAVLFVVFRWDAAKTELTENTEATKLPWS